jgi:hypothetical protein
MHSNGKLEEFTPGRAVAEIRACCSGGSGVDGNMAIFEIMIAFVMLPLALLELVRREVLCHVRSWRSGGEIEYGCEKRKEARTDTRSVWAAIEGVECDTVVGCSVVTSDLGRKQGYMHTGELEHLHMLQAPFTVSSTTTTRAQNDQEEAGGCEKPVDVSGQVCY